MIWLCHELHQSTEKVHVLLLSDVWERYKDIAEESSIMIQQSYESRRQTLKERVRSQPGDILTSFQSLDRCISDWKTEWIPMKYQQLAALLITQTH